MARALALALATVLGGCDKSAPPTDVRIKPLATGEAKADAASGRPPPSWPGDAPRPNGPCDSHGECAVLMDAPQESPCCTVRAIQPVTRVYADWTRRYQAEHCAGVTCPPAPLPGPEPACCASIGRCVNHVCVGGCTDPTLHAPETTWLDSACRLPRP